MSYQRKRITLFVVMDSLIVLCAIYFSFILLNPSFEILKDKSLIFTAIVLLLSHHIFAAIYNLYNKAWSYASVNELLAIAKAVTLSIVVTMVVQAIVLKRSISGFSRLHGCFIFFYWRIPIFMAVVRDHYIKPKKDVKRALIVGAGAAGTMLARQLLKNPDTGIEPVAYVDDDERKYMLQIHGIPVAGTVKDIEEIVEKYKIEQIIIAIPSLKQSEIQKIYMRMCKNKGKNGNYAAN